VRRFLCTGKLPADAGCVQAAVLHNGIMRIKQLPRRGSCVTQAYKEKMPCTFGGRLGALGAALAVQSCPQALSLPSQIYGELDFQMKPLKIGWLTFLAPVRIICQACPHLRSSKGQD